MEKRVELEKMYGIRDTFSGTFVRTGFKSGWKGAMDETVLLSNITDKSGKIVTDHLWFNMTKSFNKLNLQENDVVKFDARVKVYRKGYMGRCSQKYTNNWDSYDDDDDDDYTNDYDYEPNYKPISYDYKLSHPTKVVKMNV